MQRDVSETSGSDCLLQMNKAIPSQVSIMNYNIQLIFATEHLSAYDNTDILDGISSRVYATLNSLEKATQNFFFSTRIYPHMNISHLLKAKNNVYYLPTKAIKALINRIDSSILSSSHRHGYVNIFLLIYEPCSMSPCYLLRTQADLSPTITTLLTDPTYMSSYTYPSSSSSSSSQYKLSILLHNHIDSSLSTSRYIEEAVRLHIRRHLGVSNDNLQRPHSISAAPSSILSSEEMKYFLIAWLHHSTTVGSSIVSSLPTLLNQFHHLKPSQDTLLRIDEAAKDMPTHLPSNITAYPTCYIHNQLVRKQHYLRILVEFTHSPSLVNYSKLPIQYILFILAPFWVPLLAPLIKWMIGRYKKKIE
jgi:hypothetical protein